MYTQYHNVVCIHNQSMPRIAYTFMLVAVSVCFSARVCIALRSSADLSLYGVRAKGRPKAERRLPQIPKGVGRSVKHCVIPYMRNHIHICVHCSYGIWCTVPGSAQVQDRIYRTFTTPCVRQRKLVSSPRTVTFRSVSHVSRPAVCVRWRTSLANARFIFCRIFRSLPVRPYILALVWVLDVDSYTEFSMHVSVYHRIRRIIIVAAGLIFCAHCMIPLIATISVRSVLPCRSLSRNQKHRALAEQMWMRAN